MYKYDDGKKFRKDGFRTVYKGVGDGIAVKVGDYRNAERNLNSMREMISGLKTRTDN